MTRTLYYASDIHGSDVCFRKFLNAARFYGADILVMGGDVSGKAVVPIVPGGGGHLVRQLHGDRVLDRAELDQVLTRIRDRGTKESAADEAGWMLDFCVREGLLFEKGGYLYNRFQLIPSFVIEKEQLDRAVDILDRAMSMAEQRSGITAG